MTDTFLDADEATRALDKPLIVVSSDCHVSPDLGTELRPYWPQQYLAVYDEPLDTTMGLRAERQKGFVFGGDEDPMVKQIHMWNLQTEGHQDIHPASHGRVTRELDSRRESWHYMMGDLVPKRPSKYCRNYFVGARFQSRAEAESAILEDVDPKTVHLSPEQ